MTSRLLRTEASRQSDQGFQSSDRLHNHANGLLCALAGKAPLSAQGGCAWLRRPIQHHTCHVELNREMHKARARRPISKTNNALRHHRDCKQFPSWQHMHAVDDTVGQCLKPRHVGASRPRHCAEHSNEGEIQQLSTTTHARQQPC